MRAIKTSLAYLADQLWNLSSIHNIAGETRRDFHLIKWVTVAIPLTAFCSASVGEKRLAKVFIIPTPAGSADG